MEQWYQLSTKHQSGYPQPEDTWAQRTYGPSSYCDRCGIHGEPIQVFRFRGEPSATRKRLLQMNWVFDELFCVREIRSDIERAGVTGVTFGPVSIDRKGTPSGRWLHMQLQVATEVAVVLEGLQPVTCRPNNEEGVWPPPGSMLQVRYGHDYPYCGRVKYRSSAPPTS